MTEAIFHNPEDMESKSHETRKAYFVVRLLCVICRWCHLTVDCVGSEGLEEGN